MKKEAAVKWKNEIIAYCNGKIIQHRFTSDKINWSNWITVENPDWFVNSYEYRVKPESKLVPFTFEDVELLMGTVVKNKNNGVVLLIVGMDNEGLCLSRFCDNCTFTKLLSDYTFLDGKPCGRYEETN